MQVREEAIADVHKELDALVMDYYARDPVALDGMPPHEFDWPIYIQLNNASASRLFTARDDKQLLGFVVYHVVPHLHHVGLLTATCDMISVALDARGKGVGKALIEHAEHEFRKAKVRYIVHMHRMCYDVPPLFAKHGYRLVEQSYLKELR